MLETRTVVWHAELVVVWSGTLERRGKAPGLSPYRGGSTLGTSDQRAPRETPPTCATWDTAAKQLRGEPPLPPRRCLRRRRR